MELEIYDDCQTVFGCLKGIIVTLYSLVVICIIVRIIYKMHVYTHKTCSFEMIPLSSTILQSLFQLILNVFIMDTKLIISALYSQTLTFGIISTSCSQLCLRIKYPQKQRTAKRYSLVAFSIAQLASMIMYVLTLTDVIPLDCNDWFSVAYLFPMGVMLVYTITSISFGSTLINILKRNDKEVQKEESQIEKSNQIETIDIPSRTNSEPNLKIRSKSVMNLMPDKESTFIKQLKQQLQMIESLFLITIIVQILMDAIRTFVLSDYIRCQGESGERSNEFQAFNDWGQIFLTFYQIIQITPCLIAPYVFYYVPFKAKKVGGSILFSEQFLSFAAPHDGQDEFVSNDMEHSLDSRLILSENFDFSSEVNFSHNYQNKQKYGALIAQNKEEKVTKKGLKNNKEKINSAKAIEYQNINNNNNNKSQKSNKSNKSNGISNSNNRSQKENSNSNNNIDSVFVYRKQNHNDTLDNIDDFIDRMSMKKDDVDRITSQNGQSESQQQSLHFDKPSYASSMVLSDNVLRANTENSLGINSQQIKDNNHNNINQASSDTFNHKNVQNDVVDQYRVTGETVFESKANQKQKNK